MADVETSGCMKGLILSPLPWLLAVGLPRNSRKGLTADGQATPWWLMSIQAVWTLEPGAWVPDLLLSLPSGCVLSGSSYCRGLSSLHKVKGLFFFFFFYLFGCTKSSLQCAGS